MSSTTKTTKINRCQLNELIARVEHAIEHDLSLSVDDLKLLLLSITTLCELQERIEEDDVTLYKLKKLLGIVKQSEARKKSSNQQTRKNKRTKSDKPHHPKKKKMPKVINHSLTEHKKGELCPCCKKGKLYKHTPGELLRITGHAPFEAVKHITEQLRCNGCLEVYKAKLPNEVLSDGNANQKYGYSARALMSLNKFYTGSAYYHQGKLSEIMGFSISASTIYEQCLLVSQAVEPVVNEMRRQAADAVNIDIDDTHARILTQQPEFRKKRNGKGEQLRSGVYTSGLIAKDKVSHEIILFETSLGHAGEHLDSIIANRDIKLAPPIIMSDALSSNTSLYTVTKSLCNAHCRRQFYDLEKIHPTEIKWVLDTYGRIWENESKVKEAELSAKKRLEYHQAHSLSVMEELKSWAQAKLESSDFEEHSALGKAIKYLLRHYDGLVKFCYIEGAKIDNNRMEERLKTAIRVRKNAHFYKTASGAEVANILLSLIATADVGNINLFDYLCTLQRYRVEVKQEPAKWLPWTYEETLSAKLLYEKVA